MIRFINHIKDVVATIPKTSGVSKPNNCVPASLLIPTSAKGIVGKIASTKNNTQVVQTASP